VGRVRLDQAPVVVEDRFEGFRIDRRLGRQLTGNGARLDRRQDRERLDPGQVVGHQIDDAMGGGSERLRIEVAEAVGLRLVEGCPGRQLQVGHAAIVALRS